MYDIERFKREITKQENDPNLVVVDLSFSQCGLYKEDMQNLARAISQSSSTKPICIDLSLNNIHLDHDDIAVFVTLLRESIHRISILNLRSNTLFSNALESFFKMPIPTLMLSGNAFCDSEIRRNLKHINQLAIDIGETPYVSLSMETTVARQCSRNLIAFCKKETQNNSNRTIIFSKESDTSWQLRDKREINYDELDKSLKRFHPFYFPLKLIYLDLTSEIQREAAMCRMNREKGIPFEQDLFFELHENLAKSSLTNSKLFFLLNWLYWIAEFIKECKLVVIRDESQFNPTEVLAWNELIAMLNAKKAIEEIQTSEETDSLPTQVIETICNTEKRKYSFFQVLEEAHLKEKVTSYEML